MTINLPNPVSWNDAITLILGQVEQQLRAQPIHPLPIHNISFGWAARGNVLGDATIEGEVGLVVSPTPPSTGESSEETIL